MDLYRYWQEATRNKASVEGELVENLTQLVDRLRRQQPKKVVNQLMRAGKFLEDLACYFSAEIMYSLARDVVSTQEADSLLMAKVLSTLGNLFQETGKYAKGMPLFEEALGIMKRNADTDQEELAETLRQMGTLCKKQGKYPAAEEHFKNALKITKVTPVLLDNMQVIFQL